MRVGIAFRPTRGTLCVCVCVAPRIGEEGKREGGKREENAWRYARFERSSRIKEAARSHGTCGLTCLLTLVCVFRAASR